MEQIAIKHSYYKFKDLFAVYFNPCDFVNKATCKRKMEIEGWMEDKSLIIVVNQETFDYRKAADANDNKVSVDPKSLVIRETELLTVPLIYAHHRFELLHSKIDEADPSYSRKPQEFT